MLVKRLDEPELKSKYIEVISHEKEPGHYAMVMGVGPGLRKQSGVVVPPECKVGDLVIVRKYSGAPVELQTDDDPSCLPQNFQMVDTEDVLAVVER